MFVRSEVRTSFKYNICFYFEAPNLYAYRCYVTGRKESYCAGGHICRFYFYMKKTCNMIEI